MRTNAVGRIAALLLGAEGLALAALAAWQVVAVAAGDVVSFESAAALLVLTIVGAVIVIAFAVAVWRRRSWGRSGGVVTQVLILAVALGAATGAYAHPLTALVLAIPAIVTLVLLLMATRDPGRDERDEASAGSQDPA